MAKEQFASTGRNDGRLYRAVIWGDFNTAAEELRLGDVDLTVRIGCKSFLRHAGERGFKRIASILIEHGIDPNETYGKHQRSLLHFAAATHNFGFASVLLEHGANANAVTSSGAAPLHFAARSGQSYLSSELIKSGAKINAVDRLGRTPLAAALANGMTDTARLLAKSGGKDPVAAIRLTNQSKVAEAEPSP